MSFFNTCFKSDFYSPATIICVLGLLLGDIKVSAMPDTFFIGDTVYNVFCYGGADGIIRLGVTGSNPPFTYHWNDGDTTADINGLMAGIYSVTVYDAVHDSLIDSIAVYSPPQLNLVIQLSSDTVCPPDSIVVLFQPNGGVPPYSYSATQNGMDFIYTTNSSLYIYNPGPLAILVTDSNGCTFEDSTSLYACLTGVNGITPNAIEAELLPNPTNGQTRISLNGIQAQHIRIYDVAGSLLTDLEKPENNSFDMSLYSNGIYIIAFLVNNVWTQLKLAKV